MPDSEDTTKQRTGGVLGLWEWIGLGICLAFIIYFFCFSRDYTNNTESALHWWTHIQVTVYSVASFVPLISCFLMVHAWKKSRDYNLYKSLHGLWILAVGAFVALIAMRSHQPRIAVYSLPFLITGIIWCYWGGKHALRCAFPAFFLIMAAIPPAFEQSTVWMQILSTEIAHHGASLCGVDTLVEGTSIVSQSGKWGTFSIAGGCSGMNSLKTLIMIALPWAYLSANLKPWKKLVLVICSIPLAIISNAFRLISIFVLAEYVSPNFAKATWHDWSGLTLFFPASMLGLFIIHSILNGEILFFRRRKTIIRTNNQ